LGWAYAAVVYFAVSWAFDRRRVPVPEPEYELVYAD
jgi:hypothetical protein